MVFASTSTCARTTPRAWSKAPSRWTPAWPWQVARIALPSTAITRRTRARRCRERLRAASAASTPARTQVPIAASNAARSTPVRTRQIVTGPGIRPTNPSPARTSAGRSATHSPIAANERAPPTIAPTATTRIATNG